MKPRKEITVKGRRERITVLVCGVLMLIAYLVGVGQLGAALALFVGMVVGVLVTTWTWEISELEQVERIEKATKDITRLAKTPAINQRSERLN